MKRITGMTALLLLLVPLGASAQSATASVPTVSVGGDGLIQRSPDIATVSITIETNDANATRSAGENTTIYNAFKARAAALNITGDALRTTFFNVQYVPGSPKGVPPEQRQPRYGYVTSRSISVSVAPLEKVGKVIDAATASGVTDIGGVSYDLRDRKGAYREALAAALNDAKANADALASSGAFRLSGIGSVSSDSYSPIRPLENAPMMMRATPQPYNPPPTEIAPNGPISISAHVTVVYNITR